MFFNIEKKKFKKYILIVIFKLLHSNKKIRIMFIHNFINTTQEKIG